MYKRAYAEITWKDIPLEVDGYYTVPEEETGLNESFEIETVVYHGIDIVKILLAANVDLTEIEELALTKYKNNL